MEIFNTYIGEKSIKIFLNEDTVTMYFCGD